jgi:hypothetical protein
MLILAIAVLTVLTGFGDNEGGEAGHLGGAILGLLLVRKPQFLKWLDRREAMIEIIPPRAFDPKLPPKLRPRTEVDLALSTEVDRVLDKVSQHGFQSLTQAERAILVAASKSNPNFP